MVHCLWLAVPAVPRFRKYLGEESQQENPYQDGHVRYQHGRVSVIGILSCPVQKSELSVPEISFRAFSAVPVPDSRVPCSSSMSSQRRT
jgi:hypothetical protein